jgi:hypothetical protein
VIEPTTITQLNDIVDLINSGTLSLEELAEFADKSIGAQNAFARIGIFAERKVGEQLAILPADEYKQASATLRRSGWESHRIQRAERLALVPLFEVDDYLATATADGNTVTIKTAQKLAPKRNREERANFTNAYTAPPIDVEIARELGLATSDHLADVIAGSINRALENIGARYAFAWTKYHGITEEGTLGDSWTFEGIGEAIGGKSREYAESLYYRASHHVRGQIAMTALHLLQEQSG